MKVLIAGSFNPLHKGHEDIINRARELFGEVVVLPCKSHGKESAEGAFGGLLADYCIENNIDAIVKGIRNYSDFENEYAQAIINKKLCGVETIFLPASPELMHISSSAIRAVEAAGGEAFKL